MLISNYHTHTVLCHHATGTPADYVLQAKKDGCLELGFSDHCPYPVNNKDNWHYCRMSVGEVADYRQMVFDASGLVDFPVYFGFECEWDKDYKNWYEDKLKGEFGAQYLVFGPHWLTEGNNHVYVRDFLSDKQLNTYINQTIEGMSSGLYAFVAHPDLFMLGRSDWDSQAESCAKALLTAAKELHLPVEINGYGMIKPKIQTSVGERYPYPVKEFWQIALQLGVDVVCNSDAHSSEVVIENAKKACSFAEELGISVMEKVNILAK